MKWIARRLAFVPILLITTVVQAGASNSLMAISADGALLACSNRDCGTVTLVDLATRTKKFELPVGAHPEGVTFLGNTHRFAVAVYSDDQIRIVDADAGAIVATIDVFDEPYGLVSNEEGTRLWATLTYPGQVIEIDPNTASIVNEKQIGSFLKGIAWTPQSLLVTEYHTGVVKALHPETLEELDEWRGSSQDNIARQIAIHPHRQKAYVPHQRSLTTVAHGAGSIFPYISVIDLDHQRERRRKRVQMDSFRGVYVVANPWEAVVSPDGAKLYVIFGGTDDLFVCDVLDDNYRELQYGKTVLTGSNPRAIQVSSDGREFYVYNGLDFSVDVFDSESLEKTASIVATAWPHAEDRLIGKKLFYSAKPPMSLQRWISCSSCHPDGESDGRTWQQPEGLRNTQPLFGLKETHPIHWSADRDEVQDFEHTIRSELMQGRGLIRGDVAESLQEPNAGRSAMLDALAEYTNSHEFRLSPHAKTGWTPSAQRGRELFHASTTGCATCHSGQFFTDLKLHDVGTGGEDPTEKIGPFFDTPTLLGVYRSPPYLHHGKAETLKDVLVAFNPDDQHGVTSGLTSEQIDDLVAYLMMLPYEAP